MKLLLARALTGAFDAALQAVCGALLACLAVALPSVWLGGKGVHPLRAVLGFLGLQPWAGRLVLCALLCLGVYVGGSDGTFRSSKFGHSISRGPMCRVILDGSTIQWFLVH